MSQIPSPYTPPDPYAAGYYYPNAQNPYAQVNAPARRAGILMIVLASLCLACGGCSVLGLLIRPTAEQMQQFSTMLPGGKMPSTAESIVSTVALGATGLILLALGILQRRGQRGITIASIVLVSLILLYLVGSTLLGILLTAGGGSSAAPAMAITACVGVVLIVPFVLLLMWLIQALRAPAQLQLTQQQYQAAYWQYAQQMQAQAGYSGYPQQPAPTQPPAPQPQSPPPSSPQ